jgi:hypothetical protein
MFLSVVVEIFDSFFVGELIVYNGAPTLLRRSRYCCVCDWNASIGGSRVVFLNACRCLNLVRSTFECSPFAESEARSQNNAHLKIT